MKNVADIKKEKNLNYILPKGSVLQETIIERGQAVVIVHLHYRETVEAYLKYVDCIPIEVDIIFTFSDEIVNKEILEYVRKHQGRHCEMIKKNNRGRDVSALLVACREKIMKYQFVCFVHDKKEKNEQDKKFTQGWVRCLWENSLGSREYIYNILGLFQQISSLGLVVPPSPLGIDYQEAINMDLWFDNFENTTKLAQELELQCDLNPRKPPITLGTVFWARSVALKKLFEKEWCYEDFVEEPLPADGTVSHAIERIFAYVAQDAGYDTGQVMTENYASERIQYLQDIVMEAFNRLNISMGISSKEELKNYEQEKNILEEFAVQYEKIYIYGAGRYGKKCFFRLKDSNIFPDAILVSDIQQNPEKIFNTKILSIDQVRLDQTCGVIVAVAPKSWVEIKGTIKEHFPYFDNLMFMELMN